MAKGSNRHQLTFTCGYLLALGPSLLPDLQVGFVADHGLLSTQRRYLVLIKQKPQVLHKEKKRKKIILDTMQLITSMFKYNYNNTNFKGPVCNI